MTSQTIVSLVTIWAMRLTIVLACSYGLSLLARHYWIFDLFSHFMIQYAVGGLILGIILLCSYKYPLASAAFVICLCSLYHIYRSLPVVLPPSEHGTRFTIAQYNRFYFNDNFDKLFLWLRENQEKFDVVSVQEITGDALEKMQAIKNIYPYTFPERKTPGTDVYLMSRHPILEKELIITQGAVPTALGVKIKVDAPAGPVTVYAIHTETPMSKRMQLQRSEELRSMAQTIAKDTSPNIIFVGDWNITPFSPNFRHILAQSGLNNGYTSHWPAVTWPSQLRLPFLKIPIDQILFSDTMQLAEKKVMPAMGSDHHPLVASFIVKGK